MKERGKAVDVTYSRASNFSSDYNYSASSEVLCKRHPSNSPSVGICAYCLKERLINLVCSDCGEQRLSSCSCSEFSSYRNSCATDVGSVGRISFLIDNETKLPSNPTPKDGLGSDPEVVFLKRSSSSCVGVKKNNGLWKIVRLFRKKRDHKGCETSVGGFEEEKSEMWMFDCMAVSRSRSVCSFRGGTIRDPDESSDFAFSSAKISDVNGGSILDSQRPSGFSEAEPRRSGFRGCTLDGEDQRTLKIGGGHLEPSSVLNSADYQRSVFPVKESDFSGMDESGFIDLKLDLSLESKPEFSVLKSTDLPVPVSDLGSLRSGTSLGHHECGGSGSFGSMVGDRRGLTKGGSCRITANDSGGFKKEKRGHKGWRWIFRHHPNWRSSSKKGENHEMKT